MQKCKMEWNFRYNKGIKLWKNSKKRIFDIYFKL